MKSAETFAQAHLQILFDIAQRTVDSDLEVPFGGACKVFEPGPREPRWNVFHCASRSVRRENHTVSRMRTNREYVNKESAWDRCDLECDQCSLRCGQEGVIV